MKQSFFRISFVWETEPFYIEQYQSKGYKCGPTLKRRVLFLLNNKYTKKIYFWILYNK